MGLDSRQKKYNKIPSERYEGTRQSLIEAGLELFGEYGFKATSTRMLSQASGANVSAIPYYFGNKEGLYNTVVEHIALRGMSYVGPAYEEIQENLQKGKLNKADAYKALKLLIESIAVMFVDSDEPKSWALFIMREQARPTDAFDILYNNLMKNVHSLIAVLIAEYTGLNSDDDEVKIRAHALLGQILVFLSSREVILRQLGVKKLKEQHISLAHKIVWAHCEAALKVPRLDTR